MSITIKIQSNASENETFYKDITDVLTLTGDLKSDTSVVDPIFIVNQSANTIVNCNYVTIPSFNRSYFIRNINSVGSNLTEITCHVDVLSSFRDSILSNKAVISRQENSYNRYLNDPYFKIYQNKLVTTEYLSGDGFGTAGYVLVVAGG
jgi:hypothetical protein